MSAFITGRASPETKRRIADDLKKKDSYARKVLEGMASVAREPLAEVLREEKEE